MIMLVDIKPADLAEQPVVGQRLRPCGVDHEPRRLTGARGVVDAGLLQQPFERGAVFQYVDIGTYADRHASHRKCYHRQGKQRSDSDHDSRFSFQAGLPNPRGACRQTGQSITVRTLRIRPGVATAAILTAPRLCRLWLVWTRPPRTIPAGGLEWNPDSPP